MKRFVNTDTLLGAVCAAGSLALLVSSHRLSEQAFVLPGDAPPFLVPQWFLYMAIALGASIFVGGLFKGGVDFSRQNWRRIGAVALVLLLAVWLLPVLGFLLVAPLAVFVTGLLLGYRKLWINAAVSLAVPAALYAMLAGFAKMPLPKIPGMEF